jgi:hypothetical protein
VTFVVGVLCVALGYRKIKRLSMSLHVIEATFQIRRALESLNLAYERLGRR